MSDFNDSGERTEFETGAHRDLQEGKGRFDLMPFDALQEVAAVFEAGAKKYKDRNWEKGIPVSSFLSSGARHLGKAISGYTDEPHLPMAAWNLLCAIQTHIWVMTGEKPSSLGYDKALKLARKFDRSIEQELDPAVTAAITEVTSGSASQIRDTFAPIKTPNGSMMRVNGGLLPTKAKDQ